MPSLLSPVHSAARLLLSLHVLPLVVVYTALLWLRLALSSVSCRLRLERRRTEPLVCLYKNCVGGYHSDLKRAWSGLEQTVATAAPDIHWPRLRRFCLYYDDQINFPAESCRASLGFIVASGCAYPALAAAAWRQHPLAALHSLHVAVFPATDCLAADMPHCGPLSYLICIIRALHCFRTAGVSSKVPGLLEVHTPQQHRITFLLPLENRQELLPF